MSGPTRLQRHTPRYNNDAGPFSTTGDIIPPCKVLHRVQHLVDPKQTVRKALPRCGTLSDPKGEKRANKWLLYMMVGPFNKTNSPAIRKVSYLSISLAGKMAASEKSCFAICQLELNNCEWVVTGKLPLSLGLGAS